MVVTTREFGPYLLEELIGSGSMAEVYRARDTRRDRWVALKLLPDVFRADREYEARFRRESLAAARLSEPHVIPIHDYGEIDGRLYIDMRLVEGEDLGSLLKRSGPLEPARAVALVGQIAEALDAAHAAGLVHRDIKPSNVLVTHRDFVYVVDFGVARSIGLTRTSLTITGATVGTLEYMAPERFTNRPIDERADVYSLACVLAECLTGRRPFGGEDLPALMYAHIYTEPVPPSTLVPSLPRALDEVVLRGMAKRPEDRFESAGELAAAAHQALRPAVSAPPLPEPPQTLAPGRSAAGGSEGAVPLPVPGPRDGDRGPAALPRVDAPAEGSRADSLPTVLGPVTAGMPAAGTGTAAAGAGPGRHSSRRRGVLVGAGAVLVAGVAAAVAVTVLPGSTGDANRPATATSSAAGTRVGAPAASASPTSSASDVTSIANGSLSSPRAVNVPGTVLWTDSGVRVGQGQRLVIHATGLVGFISGAPPVGPNGAADLHPGVCVLPGPTHHAALIGRISDKGTPFLVGDDYDGLANQGGQLFLGINDIGVDNNSGSFSATIQVGQQ